MKLKTSPARLAQLLQSSLAFCFSLQPMPSLAASLNKMLMRTATVVKQLCKSCRTCFMFYCTLYFTCDRSFTNSSRSEESSVVPAVDVEIRQRRGRSGGTRPEAWTDGRTDGGVKRMRSIERRASTCTCRGNPMSDQSRRHD